MARGFKLNGNIEAKFSQIEKILPRIMSHMSTKTYAVIPSSILSSYKETVRVGEFIINSLLFAGNIKKVLFKIGEIEGEGKPTYSVTLVSSKGKQTFSVATRKLNHVIELNVDVEDGDTINISQDNAEVVLHNVHLAALMEIKQEYNTVKEFVTEKLLETIEDERI
jgi:hypothetical protein